MRRFSFAMMMLLLIASTASAQRRPRGFTSDPDSWLSAGVAGITGDGVNDGSTASTWDFGNAMNWQYSISLEKTVGSGTSLGLGGSYARIPFVYRGPAVPVINGSGATCTSCEAHLDMTTVVATLHIGAGSGFHQAIEVNGGIVSYARLTSDSNGERLAGGNNIDPVVSGGWGFGYGFDERTQIEFVPEWSLAIHERTGLSNGVRNTNIVRTLKLSFRMGFGARSVRR